MWLIKYSAARAFTKAAGNKETRPLKTALGLALLFGNGAPASWKEEGGWEWLPGKFKNLCGPEHS